MTTLIVVALLFVVFGVVFMGVGLGIGRAENRFRSTAGRAAATVTDVRSRSAGRNTSGLIWVPVVRFQTSDGRMVDAEASGGTNIKSHSPGDSIEVLYDPANPANVRVPGGPGGGLIQGVFMAIGGIFSLIGVLLVAIAVAVA